MNNPTNTITGILIDPHLKTITTVSVDGVHVLQAMHELIGCQQVTVIKLGTVNCHSQDLWIDEEGILMDWDQQAFFQLAGHDDPLAGRALIFASDFRGDTVSADVPVSMVEPVVRWIDREKVDIPAPFMITQHPDGTQEKTILAKTERWTYANQPS